MAAKPYDWENARLELHTEQKHKILRDYIFDYIMIRCTTMPAQKSFRLAFIDGFCGGGCYTLSGNAPGSPLIFLEQLKAACDAVAIKRREQNLEPIIFDCFLLCSDSDPKAIALLEPRIEKILAEIKDSVPNLKCRRKICCAAFEKIYPSWREFLLREKFHNVLFYLDPCGYTDIEPQRIRAIMTDFRNAEVFYTFMLGAALRYKDKSDTRELKAALMRLGVPLMQLNLLDNLENIQAVAARVERLFWEFFRECAFYVSPLAVHYEHGYGKYWLVHFAMHHAARSAYNDVLHRHANGQIHVGDIGFLAYHTKYDGMAYLFDTDGREKSGEILQRDVYNLLHENGDGTKVLQFLQSAYRDSLNHSDDINKALITNPDIEIITSNGRKRIKQLKKDDILRLKPQKSFFSFGWNK